MPTDTTIIDQLRVEAERFGTSAWGNGEDAAQLLARAAAALTAAHAARDAAERERDENERAALGLMRMLAEAIRERDEARAAIGSALAVARSIAHPEHTDGCVGPEWYQGADAVLEALHEVFSGVPRGTGVSP